MGVLTMMPSQMMPLPEFLETYSLSSLQAIKADLTDHYSGQPLLQQMLDKIVTPDDYRYPSMSGGCFIAGTMVWTDNGLVPIDQLKVGDSVLSQPESTGEKAYRKVERRNRDIHEITETQSRWRVGRPNLG
jgi:hypothetical protein